MLSFTPMFAYTGMIIPAYYSPWPKLIKAAELLGPRLIVIANVPGQNGPPRKKKDVDQNFVKEIPILQQHGAKVIGYVHTCWGFTENWKCEGANICVDSNHACWTYNKNDKKLKKHVIDDIDHWYYFYPMIDGIFFDEVAKISYLSESMAKTSLALYQEYHKHVKDKDNNSMIVLNPNTSDQEYYQIGASIIVPFEGTCTDFIKWKPATSECSKLRKSAVIVHSTPQNDLMAAIGHATGNDIPWVYFRHDFGGYHNGPPPYFDDVILYLKYHIFPSCEFRKQQKTYGINWMWLSIGKLWWSIGKLFTKSP